MENKKKIAVVLSGCGVFDGSEIHEAVMTLYAVVKHGAVYEVFAPEMEQYHVIDHYRGQETQEKRNVLVESARIARGKAKPLSAFDGALYDGLVFPGGYGAAKNLSDFAFKGSKCHVRKEVANAILQMSGLGKPIGAFCIAPVILVRVLGNVKVTIGDDPSTADAIREMGGAHEKAGHGQVVIDEVNKIVSTPCYMLDANIAKVAEGIDRAIEKILAFTK